MIHWQFMYTLNQAIGIFSFGSMFGIGATVLVVYLIERTSHNPPPRHAGNPATVIIPNGGTIANPTTHIPRVINKTEVDQVFADRPRIKDQHTQLIPTIGFVEPFVPADWETVKAPAPLWDVPKELRTFRAWTASQRAEDRS